LLDQVTNRTIEVSDGVVTVFDGNYAAFREAKREGKLPAPVRPGASGGVRAASSSGRSDLERLLEERPAAAPAAAPSGLNA
ncbi:hypothetical protein, partial [Klebsiella pneumoniae]|uniref:hypothetical protein n=1 Tax=Klebsiella pneumoniae TaxID=573 RepID=UPI003EE332C9